jgi:hypothetical protein
LGNGENQSLHAEAGTQSAQRRTYGFFISQGRLPEAEDFPAQLAERSINYSVALTISQNLLTPGTLN